MLMIRLQRIGRKNDPSFRMVVLEKTSGPKAGTNVEVVGTYNPKTKQFAAEGERIKHWLSKGAQLSPSLHNLLVEKQVIEGAKIQVISEKNLTKNQKKEEEAAPAEGAIAAAVAEAEPVEEAPAETADASVEAPAETASADTAAPAEAPAA